MDVFFVTPDGAIEGRNWQEERGWEACKISSPHSASPDGGVAAVSRSEDHIEVFWIGQYGSVEAAYWTTSNCRWTRHMLAPTYKAARNSRVAALSLFDGHMEVWWVDTVGAIRGIAWRGFWEGRYHLTENGTASAAGSLIACTPSRRHPSDYVKGPPRKNGSIHDVLPGRGVALDDVTHLFWTTPNGGTRHGSKFEGSTWRFTPAWDGRSACTPHCLCAMADDSSASVDVYIIMDDLRLVRAHGKRAEHPDGEEKVGPLKELPVYKWAFARDVIATDEKNRILCKESGTACVSRSPGRKEVFWTTPNGGVRVLSIEGKMIGQFNVAPAGTVDSASPLAVLSRCDEIAELWCLSEDGALLGGSVESRVM